MGRAFEYRKAAKMKRWGKMSRVFPRLSKAITMAAKEGGPDPDTNSTLRNAIRNAKAENMPKDNIDRAIKKATGKDAADYTEISYEGKGPHGVLIFIECATDNTTRTVANVRSYFNKADGALIPNGSLEFMFDRKAVIEFTKTDEIDVDELELELIDAGLEEIEYDAEENKVIVTGNYTDFGTLTTAIEDLKIEIDKSKLQRFATTPVEFNEEQTAEIEKLLEKIDEDDDVQDVYTNMA
jgi:YebC/PmpR family DNA-binding regulatory protein